MSGKNKFPRTSVGGVSLPRLIVGTNWFLGYSHTSLAKDKFIKDFQSRKRIAEVLKVFLITTSTLSWVRFHPSPVDSWLTACRREIIRIYTPIFDLDPQSRQRQTGVFDQCASYKATFCMPHQCVTDALLDRRAGTIRELDLYTHMIRERGMIPGLSTHMPETVIYADNMNADVETYIQIYNSAGFLMQVEADWVMRVISEAKKPVMTIKPLAAGKILPVVGLAFVWNTIRDQDMVTIGTTTPDEAREVIDLSLDLLARRLPENELQKTRSKRSLQK
jgi:hypothetical protein